MIASKTDERKPKNDFDKFKIILILAIIVFLGLFFIISYQIFFKTTTHEDFLGDLNYAVVKF